MSKCHTVMCMDMSVHLKTQQMGGRLAVLMSWKKVIHHMKLAGGFQLRAEHWSVLSELQQAGISLPAKRELPC